MHTTKSSAELHNSSYSLELNGDNRASLIFKDPFSGERLQPDSVPTSLEQQPKMHQGFDYLRAQAGELTVSIMGVSHGQDAEIDKRYLQKSFLSHDSLFLEGLGHSQSDRDLVWDLSAGNKSGMSDDELGPFNSFNRSKLSALEGVNKPVYITDISSDGEDYERSLMEWGSLFDQFRDQSEQPEASNQEGLKLAAGINLVGTTILREWYMIGGIGYELSTLQQANHKSSSPLFVVGKLHAETLPMKLKALGVKSSVILPRMNNAGIRDPADIPFDFIQAVAECATQTDL